ncbi:MAG: DapH/DapD/GlmU-related protein [Sphingobium sp.]
MKIKASEGRISIGAGTRIGTGAVIGGHDQGVIIGKDCIIGARVTIMGVNYRYDRTDIPIRDQGLVSKGPIIIGDDVRIGDGAVILDAVEIESGAIVAPRAVITARVRAALTPDIMPTRVSKG